MADNKIPYDFDKFDMTPRKKSSPHEDTQEFDVPHRAKTQKPVRSAPAGREAPRQAPPQKQRAQKSPAQSPRSARSKPASRASAPPAQRRTRQAPPAQNNPSARRPQTGQAQKSGARRPANTGAKRNSGRQTAQRGARQVSSSARAARARKILSYCTLVFIVMAVSLVMCLTIFFKISAVSVEGESIYAVADIVDASGIDMDENLFTCKTKKAEQDVVTKLPYIGKATVKRKIPDKIVIIIEPTEAQYAFKCTDGETVLTNGEGKVLEKGAMPSGIDKAVFVKCEEPSKTLNGSTIAFPSVETLELIKSITDKVEKAQLNEITMLDISSLMSVKLSYQGRITLVLGEAENIASKLALARKVILRENQIDPQQYGEIDLTVDKKAYFKPLKETTTEPQPEKPESE